jgi:acyl-CoA thioester hydrolase
MAYQVHRYPLTILEKHLDTFGHVNNATYLELFEEARWDWIHGNGYGLAKIRETGQGPTILEIQLRFKRELRNRTSVIIETFVEAYESKVGTLVQRIVDAEGQLYCDTRMLFGLFDLGARKLVEPTPEWRTGVGHLDDTSGK